MDSGVGLSRKNDRGASFTNDPRRSMIGKGGLRARDDFLSLVGEEDDEVVLLPFGMPLCQTGSRHGSNTRASRWC